MNSQPKLDSINSSISAEKMMMRIKSSSALPLYRMMIAYRFFLAIFGGYLLASLSAMVIAKTFMAQRADAVMSATLIAFSLHCAAFIWVFMVNKTLKASLGIFIPCLILWITYHLMGN